MRVQCAVEKCPSIYVSGGNPSPNGVRYVCSHHSDRELFVAGILRTKRTDRDVHFQRTAHESYDTDYATPGHPLGTELGRKVNQGYCHPLPIKPEDGSKTFSSMIDELTFVAEPIDE